MATGLCECNVLAYGISRAMVQRIMNSPGVALDWTVGKPLAPSELGS